MIKLRPLRSESGFTIVEMVAAMGIFALAAAFVLGTLVAGIRTAGSGRDRTIAKELARERLEEMRRLPFYLQVSSQYPCVPQVRTDLLDTYFPNLTAPGYSSANSTYTRTIDPIPGFPRFSMTVESKFVDEELATVTPPSTYSCASSNTDRPPGNLLAVLVTVRWGPSKQFSYTLRTHLGETRLSTIEVLGAASGVMTRVDTAFSDGSIFVMEIGSTDSSIFVGDSVTARNETSAGRATITDSAGSATSREGSRQSVAAPPDSALMELHTAAQSLIHPSLLFTAATLNANKTSGVAAKINESPGLFSEGSGKILPSVDKSVEGGNDFEATNEVEGALGTRSIDNTKPYVASKKVAGFQSESSSSCKETADKVSCEVKGATAELRLFPVALALPTDSSSTDGYLVAIRFTEIKSEAIASRLGAASALARNVFSGDMFYWELDPATSVYTKRSVSISSTSGSTNALPAPSSVCVRAAAGVCDLTLANFILDWSALTAAQATSTASVGSDGRSAEAALDGVVRITTQPSNFVNSLLSNSGFIVKIGSFSTRAVDNR
ncbi:MAG: type II secretion system GspH family protein [Actinobacteria bacterium]|nr:type II secretion system GspH family protein [Actinomycetota bacterium]